MKLSSKGQKALKIVHLASVIAWVGSAIVMNVIRHLVTISDNAGMYYMADFLEAVDMKYQILLYSVLSISSIEGAFILP